MTTGPKVHPHPYRGPGRLAGLYTMGRDGKPLPAYVTVGTTGYKAWRIGAREFRAHGPFDAAVADSKRRMFVQAVKSLADACGHDDIPLEELVAAFVSLNRDLYRPGLVCLDVNHNSDFERYGISGCTNPECFKCQEVK